MLQIVKRLNTKSCDYVRRHFLSTKLKPPWNVLFFGSDDFSIASLKLLNHEYKNFRSVSKLEVVTGPKVNPVRKFALKESLKVHDWPFEVPCNHEFHLGIVVSFGHLIPKNVINMFPFGMLNVHASLLPRWRGAAPIIYAIAKGDKQTGVTIMKVKPDKFDVGEIVMQKPFDLNESVTMPEVHEKLSQIGASALLDCVKTLPDSLKNCKEQPSEGVTLAPRVNNTISNVDWHRMSAREVYNLSRALVGMYHLTTTWNGTSIKLINVQQCFVEDVKNISPGKFVYDKRENKLQVQCCDGEWISVEKIGIFNKKPMNAKDFINGYIKKRLLDDRIFK